MRADVRAANQLGPFSVVEGLHTSGATEFRPLVRAGGTHLYFSSNRARDAAAGNDGYDAYLAIRNDGGSFTTSAVPGLGGPAVADLLDWVSEDECRFYFSRREKGTYTILVLERSRR